MAAKIDQLREHTFGQLHPVFGMGQTTTEWCCVYPFGRQHLKSSVVFFSKARSQEASGHRADMIVTQL